MSTLRRISLIWRRFMQVREMLHGMVMMRVQVCVCGSYIIRPQLSIHTMHNASDVPLSVQLAVLTRNQ